MAFLGWLFIRHVFVDYLPQNQLDSYIAGLILLAAAPCTAMVFVWSNLVKGDPYFMLSQVALNDAIMIFAFAPLVALLLGVASISVPWDTLTVSVVFFIVIPVIIAQLIRGQIVSRRPHLAAQINDVHVYGARTLIALAGQGLRQTQSFRVVTVGAV
jgi:ACR3 family arsenite transporter